MTIDEALLLPPDEVDYVPMDEARLLALATQTEEPFVATSALSELRRRNSIAAAVAARVILATASADRHLRALAVSALFDGDLRAYLPELIELLTSTVDPLVLGAVIDGVMIDPEEFATAETSTFVDLLARQARSARPDEFTDAESWASFLARFGA